ncbi:MAG: aromatic ring-hydroxylating dioxygenase subunit alpha [Pirellulales bacterium]
MVDRVTNMSGVRDARSARSLDAKYYACEELFAVECEKIFRREWICVGREADVAVRGDYLRTKVGGAELIVVRDESGIRCFHNTCRHRGTLLCESECGTNADGITCPYHGWSYELSGQLIAAPNMGDVDGFDLSDYPLNQTATATRDGFVFVNVGCDVDSFETIWQPLDGKFDPWSLSELISAGESEYEVAANWKLIFQNYNECYHCPQIHPRLNAVSPYTSASNDLESGGFLGGPMQLAATAASMTFSGRACCEPLPNLPSDDCRRVYYYSLFPSLLMALHPDFVLTHRAQPLANNRTRVVCNWLFHPQAVAEKGFDPSPAIEFWDETNRQDWHICELAQQGIESSGYKPGPYSNLESTIAAFDRHYLAVLGNIA